MTPMLWAFAASSLIMLSLLIARIRKPESWEISLFFNCYIVGWVAGGLIVSLELWGPR